MQEVLFPEPTARTPRFDDYTEGSYHVDPTDLARGLVDHALACGLHLSAVMVIGPVGPLWSYYIAVLIEREDRVQLNTVVMPHARITLKATGVLTRAEATSHLQAISKAPGVHPGRSAAERRQGFLLVTFGPGEPEYFHAEVPGIPGRETAVLEHVNALLREAERTYPPPESAK